MQSPLALNPARPSRFRSNLQRAYPPTISPPFGLNLFVMRGVAPRGVTMGDVYAASVPFLLLDLLVMGLLLAFPSLVLWLPSLISK